MHARFSALVAMAALSAVAAAADVTGCRYGTAAGVLLVFAVFGGCGLVHSLRSRRIPRLTRPAGDTPVTKPRPLAGLPH